MKSAVPKELYEKGGDLIVRLGGRFSKAPKTFRARKAIAKSRNLRLQTRFIDIF